MHPFTTPRTHLALAVHSPMIAHAPTPHRLLLVVLAMLATPLKADTAASHRAVDALKAWVARPLGARPPLVGASFARTPLTRDDANVARHLLWADHLHNASVARRSEWETGVLEQNGVKMPFMRRLFGDPFMPPDGGRSLFISLHGGGATPKEVNDGQWTNQLALAKAYAPAEGLYLAPRAPTDTWDLWHLPHIDALLDRLIEDAIVFDHVNPDRVYLMGYSAGGDGVYQLAPRMADRWAAAAMMAGHPGDASPVNLRNVPFAIQVGADDKAYHRNELALEWGQKLDDLRAADPHGYEHFAEAHAGMGHWMKLADRKAVPWMEKFTREPHPDHVVWRQDDVTHRTFYWLALPSDETPKPALQIDAHRGKSEITVSASASVKLAFRVDETMATPEETVAITKGDAVLFKGTIPRTIAILAKCLAERADPRMMFSGEVTVAVPGPP
jgi:hypothetical protein